MKILYCIFNFWNQIDVRGEREYYSVSSSYIKTDCLSAQFNKYNKYVVLSKTFKSGGIVGFNELCIMMGDTSSRERSHNSHRGLIQEALQLKVLLVASCS